MKKALVGCLVLCGCLSAHAVNAGGSGTGVKPAGSLSGWEMGGGVSYFSFDPSLPRDLVNHETHPDDLVFLTGSAGTTDLKTVNVTMANLSLQRAIGTKRRGMRYLVRYTFKYPASREGKLEAQNENDFRPATEGSFVYTKIDGMNPAHELGAGVSFERLSRSGLRYSLQPMIMVGYWKMKFEKGWDRFGKDETAFVAEGKGFSLSPQIALEVGTKRLRLSTFAGYRIMNLDYETDALGSETAKGWEAGVAFVLNMSELFSPRY